MKAYEVTCFKHFPFMRVIVAAETPEQARARSWQAARDCDFKVKYIDFRAKRAREFDKLAKDADKSDWSLGWSDAHMSFGCLANSPGG